MTCRVARLSPDLPRIDLVFCCESGSSDLKVCGTLKSLGPHLRPVQGRVWNVEGKPDAITEVGQPLA